MTVLVAYASRHGATAGVAERIGDDLRAAGVPTDVRSVKYVRDPGQYDAFVIGGAAYVLRWLREATAFVRHHRAVLAERPVWLFSSSTVGTVGTVAVAQEDQDVLRAVRPKEFDELTIAVNPRGDRVFVGAPDVPAPGSGRRLLRVIPAARSTAPPGVVHDWPSIDAWAAEIAAELRHPSRSGTGVPVSRGGA